MPLKKNVKDLNDQELVDILVKSFMELSSRNKVFLLSAALILSNVIWLVCTAR